MTAASLPIAGARAVTRPFDAPGDLLDELGPDGAVWLHDGAGFVTSGVLTRIAPAAAPGWLAALDHDDTVGRPGAGPVAIGALPFDPARSADLVVPRRIVGRDAEGRGWVTEIGPRTAEGPPGRATGRRPAREHDASPTELAVRERMTRAEWHDAVDAALDAIARGDLEKVVLARRVDVEADRPFDARAVLGRLQVDQPGCFVYAVDGMLGASPELLVRRVGVAVESRPMAGTSVTLDDAALEELARSSKDAREHRPVVNAIVDALTPWCERLLVAAEPEVARFASVAHLATPIRGTLREPAPDAAAIAIALHPTPAVGGTPTDAALAMIRSLEPCGRDRYAGPVGWVDAHGDGEWVVALRGAAIDGTRAVLHAGAGIVAGSVPDDEWRETEAKLEPMMRALVLERRPLAGALSATPR